MATTVKRSLVKSFLNTGTLVSPVWSLIGDGVKTGKIAYNPKITDETYISNDSATISVDSYAPKMPIAAKAKVGDAVFTFLDASRIARDVMGDAETQVVNVWLYQTPAGGYYQAEQQSVAVACDDFGGDGGAPVEINYTIDYIGDPTLGIFNPTPTAAFAAAPVLAVLATLVLGSGTLAPLFATNKSNLLYTTSIAASSVTMVSTCIAGGAVVVQKVGTDVVNQAAAAALSMGLNHLTVQVTVGSEVVTYRIDATRTV
jgi:hypothetical protein